MESGLPQSLGRPEPARRAEPETVRLPTWRLLGYSATAIPLAMAALPIYVNVPKFYSTTIGLNLTAIGLFLLLARVFDAVQDPLLGLWSDRTREAMSSRWGRGIWLLLGAPLLAGAMVGLFNPPALAESAMQWWLLAMLLVIYTAFSMVQISYQAMGAEFSPDPVERTRITAIREGIGLTGVFVAAALPQVLADMYGARTGYAMFAFIFVPVVLVAVSITLSASPTVAARPRPQAQVDATASTSAIQRMLLPLRNLRFRKLLMIFVFNGIAAAIPATLVLFYIQDVIAAPKLAGWFLLAYFAAGALGMPYWNWLAARIGKARAWMIGMIFAVVAFIWAFTLRTGDADEFFVICVLSGLALGADLALPPAILADVIDDDEEKGLARNEGAYFGLWNLVTKMNLALAAGIALPLLAWYGYTPGAQNTAKSLTYLAGVYALLPCGLKGIAAILLMQTHFLRREETK